MRVGLGREPDLAADIVFRYLERLGQALAGRLEWFRAIGAGAPEPRSLAVRAGPAEPLAVASSSARAETWGMASLVSRALGMRPRILRPHGQSAPARLHVAESAAAPTGLARR